MTWAILARLGLRALPYAAALAALIGAYTWTDHRGYQRGYAAKNAEVIAAANRLRVQADRLNAALARTAAERDAALNDRLTTTQAASDRAQTIIIREAANDPRYRSAQCSLSVGVRAAIDDARGLSDRAHPDAASGFTVPPSATTGR